MHPVLRGILAVIVGWFVGSFVNMAIIEIGHKLFPVDVYDPNNIDAYIAAFKTLEFKYFVFPLLGHAIGTLVGAFVAALVVKKNKMKFALAIGGLFFIGGVLVNIWFKSPLWFWIVDIVFAYIPMAWIGGKIAMRFSKKH